VTLPCATCGEPPVGEFHDGSPRYRCGPHLPIFPGMPVHPAYAAALGSGAASRTIVELDEAEMGQAAACGRKRLAQAKRSKSKDYLGWDSLEAHTMGAQGERAFSKWIGEPWDCTTRQYGGKPDVRGIQIRTIPFRGRRLKVRADDPPRMPVVLVVASPPKFWIRGWMLARDARRPEWLDDPGDLGKPAHFVPTKDLRPMVEFYQSDVVRAALGMPPL
jgi:hypothetical protein